MANYDSREMHGDDWVDTRTDGEKFCNRYRRGHCSGKATPCPYWHPGDGHPKRINPQTGQTELSPFFFTYKDGSIQRKPWKPGQHTPPREYPYVPKPRGSLPSSRQHSGRASRSGSSTSNIHIERPSSSIINHFDTLGVGGMLPQRLSPRESRDGLVTPTVDPFFGSMVPSMGSIMSGMSDMSMSDLHRSFDDVRSGMMNNPNSHTFQQSSYETYTNTGHGAPRVYQETSSLRSGPGGIKETTKSLRDSERGIERMSVGHHINDRGHMIERSREHGGRINENQEFINVGEDEALQFDQEFQQRWRRSMGSIDRRHPTYHQGSIGRGASPPALPDPRSYGGNSRGHRE